MKNKHTSKFLSYVLRHAPETIGLNMDENGWVSTIELIAKSNLHNRPLDMELLLEVVHTNEKKRFAFNEDQSCIRASQGHSVEIELNLQPQQPPTVLYHGTVAEFISSIRENGLEKMSRHHVHLSAERSTAAAVGGRRGKPVVLTIASGSMHEKGHIFYCSANGVWLCDAVPVEFIEF